MSGEADGGAVLFEAVLTPRRSLDRRGLGLLMAALAGLSVLVSAGLWLAGAWPVIGFTGLEAGLAIWLLRRHAIGTGESELLVLTAAGLRVVRTSRGRRSERFLPSAWLSARLEDRWGGTPGLLVRSRGSSVEVAQFLGADEKRQLASALSDAVRRQQNPVFDNPQLRVQLGVVNPRPDPST